MCVDWNDKSVTLRGDPSLLTNETTFKGVEKTIKMGNTSFWIEMVVVDIQETNIDSPTITAILDQF